MATTPPKTNLFGSFDNAKGGDSSAIVAATTTNSLTNNSSGTGSSGNNDSASSWFEEDDELLLSQLLSGEETEDNLDQKLNRLRGRLESDLSRISIIISAGGVNGDGWWNSMLRNATSCGFECQSSPGSNASPASAGEKKELPKSFNTPSGQAHLKALVDLLGISRERAVKITLASLRSFASVGGGGATATSSSEDKNDPVASADSDKENEKNKKDDDDAELEAKEQEAKLRSLLGTSALFHRVLSRHRQQFVARLRVLTESLRLEQEGKVEETDHAGSDKSVGKSCGAFLDKLDSKLSINEKKRGLFHLLVRLATGPPLPGMGGGEMPYSVSQLRGNSNSNVEGGEESLVAIRNEASEALLVLLYDRIDGGVQRVDLWMVLESATRCGEYEFGMSAEQFSRGGVGGRNTSIQQQQQQQLMMLEEETTSPALIMERMKQRLNGLWALICAECMGLWRASGNNGNEWVEQHPFFSGLDLGENATIGGGTNTALGGKRGAGLSLQTGNAASNDPNKQAQKELEALCQKLCSLGENVSDRRRAAYSSRKRESVQGADDDDELWGVQAPEAVALLTFGMLLRLAHMSCSTKGATNEFVAKLGERGSECAQSANDDCGAFAYLHRIMERMVVDPLKDGGGNSRRRMIGDNALVKDLLKRGEIEMAVVMDESSALMEEGTEDNQEVEELAVSDAASIVYASIGREILSATVRAFREALLSLQSRSSAVENIGMLADLASVIYRNEKILCEQFWMDWEEFCQGSEGMNDEEESNTDVPMCYLLDASHSLAVSTLEELKHGGSQQVIIHYLKPLSTFLHLIASLCASSSMVQSVLTSEFLPEGLLGSAMSVVAALAPMIPSLNEAANGGQGITAEERGTIRYATVVLRSISTLVYLGGQQARECIRESLAQKKSNVDSSQHGAAGTRMLHNIAAQVLPRTQNSLEGDCAALSSSALNLLVDLLADGDLAFQMETMNCFSSSSAFGGGSYGAAGESKMSGFAPFITGGMHSSITLAAMSILNCLAVNMTQNVFDTTSTSGISSGTHLTSYVETIGSGVMASLDALSTLVSSGEVAFPTSKVQVASAHAIVSSMVATLTSLKQIIYLHSDDEVRPIALVVRNDIINALSSSTPLGQVVAFLATSPLSLGLTKKASKSRELVRVMDSAVYHVENKQDRGGKYGAWGRFVTPKRARQRRASSNRSSSKTSLGLNDDDDGIDHGKEDIYSDLYHVVDISLSLLLVWGEHAEDISSLTDEPDNQNILSENSPCTLLLSRASPSSLRQPHHHPAMAGLNVASLNLISRYANVDDVLLGGRKCDAALLSSKVVKMCLRHTKIATDMSQHHDAVRSSIGGLSAFRAALGGGTHMFTVLLDAFDKIVGDGSQEDDGSNVYFERMEQLVFLISIMMETVAVSVSSQPDLARAILLGGENSEDWRLVNKMVMCLMSTSDLINASSESKSVDNRVLNLQCLVTCAVLHVVSELWKSCRLTCNKQNSNSNSDSVHACGIITSYLTNPNNSGTSAASSLVANITAELTRCALLAVMALDDKNSMCDEITTMTVNRKCILLDLLTRSFDIITMESVGRVQTNFQGGTKFIEDLFDSGPMECWKVLLSSGHTAASATSSWFNGFTASIGRNDMPNWIVSSFLQANPPEEDSMTSSWCSFGSAVRLAKALSPHHGVSNSVGVFRKCDALHVLTQAEASFAASWATFSEVIMANVIATRPAKDVYPLTSVLADTALLALSSMSESKMISESMLSSNQGLLTESRDTKPVEELCSLLLYSLTVRRDFIAVGEEGARDVDCQHILEMIGRLYESANKLFVLTQLGSVSPSNQEAVCLIRQKLLTSALILISEFESQPQEGRARDDVVKYNELRIGFTDLAVNALQSLQYVQLGVEATATVKDAPAPSKYGYGFGAISESTSSDTAVLGQEAAFQLLRASLSLLARLAPTPAVSSTQQGNYQTYTYGTDFAACLKERNTFHFLEYHLNTASNVASLTYQAVHAGSSTPSVTVIHNNAVDLVHLITTFYHALTDSGSTTIDILLLLMENRCFRSLIDNSLLKTSCKLWASNSGPTENAVMHPSVTQHRGYYTGNLRHADNVSTSKSKPSSRKDSVHFIWREVISIFSSLLRSARCQVRTYRKVDEPIIRQLTPVTSVVLDFICTYENEIFACFTSMASEARAQSYNLSSRGGKTKSTFSSSIQSSSFAFTSNLLKESADISSLFAELCKGGNKNEFARQCPSIYENVISTSLELTKITSSFLGSIGNARELFLALSSASGNLSSPAAMFEAHPLLAEGIPNARHDAIRNAHYAHSCCVLATAEDFTNSHNATTKAAETSDGKDKSLEQSFQIQVNNKFIAEVEQVAGHCLCNALAILSDTHPASDSFISFSTEEASLLDVAAVMSLGTTVAIQTSSQHYLQRYRIQPHGGDIRYGRAIGCDRSTHTISVEYADSATVEHHVPWSWIVGMEDTSKRQSIFSYLPAPKSIAEAGTHGLPSLGYLILALKWCRHVGLTSMNSNANHCPMQLTKCVAERAAILLCTEVLLHDELRDTSLQDDTTRTVNMQLLDLFDYSPETESVRQESQQGDKSLALAIGEDVFGYVQKSLKRQLRAASMEREEEQKMWEQNNAGWDNTSFWGSSTKRQGRRSPFRLVRKASSDLS